MAEVKQPAVGLKFDPDTVAPIAAPFVLAPPIFVVFALFPPPTIGMNRNPVFRTVFMPHLDMPAITLAVANNLCRCSGGSQSQRAGGPEDNVGQTLHADVLREKHIINRRVSAKPNLKTWP